MFIKVVLGIVVYLFATFWCSLGVINPLTVICLSNPLINYLKKKNLINAKGAKARNCITIVFWLVIDIVVIACVFFFAPVYLAIVFAVGSAIILLFGLGKLGPTENNKLDFIRSYEAYLTGDADETVVAIMKFPRG